MTKRAFACVTLLAALIGCADGAAPAGDVLKEESALVTADPNHFEVAFHWAPVHIQSFGSTQDFIRRFDFDFDFIGTNNRANLDGFDFEAAIYYAVAESTSHFFITYAFFHPNDGSTGICDSSHENDMEPMLVVVRKDGTAFGSIDAIFTSAHGENFAYRNDSRITAGGQASHALRSMQLAPVRPGETHQRPFTYQEPVGHGLYHCGEIGEQLGNFICPWSTANLPDCNALTFKRIRYVPSRGFADASTAPAAGQVLEFRYRLLDLTTQSGLFYRRFNFETFADFNGTFPRSFRGAEGNSAGAPWAAFIPSGQTRPNPAGFVNQYLTFNAAAGLPPPNANYRRNDFAAGGNVCTVISTPFTSSLQTPPCVNSVCSQDSFCCNNHWDITCVNEAKTICGTTCSSCAHSPDVQGVALVHSCSQCVADVCNRDPFCCASSWDGLCVGKARACEFRYEVSLQTRGWLDPCGNDGVCGSNGSGLSLESIRIYNPPSGGLICYQTHVTGTGWLPEVCDGALNETQGPNRRIEAVKIRLLGQPVGHRVCYTATVAGVTQNEVCDGAIAGTTNQSLIMESLKVRIVQP